jgi:hypothetical protein
MKEIIDIILEPVDIELTVNLVLQKRKKVIEVNFKGTYKNTFTLGSQYVSQQSILFLATGEHELRNLIGIVSSFEVPNRCVDTGISCRIYGTGQPN